MVISDPRHTECSTVHHVPKCMSCHKAIVVITGGAHCFHDCIYIYVYIYTNLPVNTLVRLLHPRSGDSQGQETFLAPSADKQTRNYDTECYIYKEREREREIEK